MKRQQNHPTLADLKRSLTDAAKDEPAQQGKIEDEIKAALKKPAVRDAVLEAYREIDKKLQKDGLP